MHINDFFFRIHAVLAFLGIPIAVRHLVEEAITQAHTPVLPRIASSLEHDLYFFYLLRDTVFTRCECTSKSVVNPRRRKFQNLTLFKIYIRSYLDSNKTIIHTHTQIPAWHVLLHTMMYACDTNTRGKHTSMYAYMHVCMHVYIHVQNRLHTHDQQQAPSGLVSLSEADNHGIEKYTNTQPISVYCTLSPGVRCTIYIWNMQVCLRIWINFNKFLYVCVRFR